MFDEIGQRINLQERNKCKLRKSEIFFNSQCVFTATNVNNVWNHTKTSRKENTTEKRIWKHFISKKQNKNKKQKTKERQKKNPIKKKTNNTKQKQKKNKKRNEKNKNKRNK